MARRSSSAAPQVYGSTEQRRPAPPVPRGQVRRRYHFRLPGLVYVLVTLLVALGAFNSQNNLLFWAFGFSLAVLVVSGLISGAMLMSLDVVRLPVADHAAGEPGELRYAVTNRARILPAFAMRLEELAPTGRAPRVGPETRGARRRRAALDDAFAPADSSRAKNYADILEAPWTAHLHTLPVFVVHVGPRQTIIANGATRGLRRGRTHLVGVRLYSSFPFGLIGKSMEFVQRQEVVVLPAPAPVRRDLLSIAGRAGESGVASSRPGHGEEFHSLREYIPGDPTRNIAWRATARQYERTGDLLIRQTAADTPRRLWIVVRIPPGAAFSAGSSPDALTFASSADPSDWERVPAPERAISLAAGLTKVGARNGYAVGLVVPLANLALPCGVGPGNTARMLRAMGEIDLAQAARQIRPGHDPGFPSGLDVGSVGGSAGGLVIVIHAGPVDTGFTRRAGRTTHISTDHVERVLEAIDSIPPSLPHRSMQPAVRRSEARA